MEQHSPVLFLDLNSDDLSTGMELGFVSYVGIFEFPAKFFKNEKCLKYLKIDTI